VSASAPVVDSVPSTSRGKARGRPRGTRAASRAAPPPTAISSSEKPSCRRGRSRGLNVMTTPAVKRRSITNTPMSQENAKKLLTSILSKFIKNNLGNIYLQIAYKHQWTNKCLKYILK